MNFRTFASAAVAVAALAGCAGQVGYQKAFSAQTAPVGNKHTFAQPPPQVFGTVKRTLVQQGFSIEQSDLANGLLKATRNLQDPSDKDVSYNVNVSVDVTADSAAEASIVTLAASQQTILHREWHTWWHLLWIIPLFPTGTEYQTVVTKEGNVTDQGFYQDFFTAIEKELPERPANLSATTPAAMAGK